MLNRIRYTLLAGAFALAISACGRSPSEEPVPVTKAIAGNLQVVNRSSQDMDIFLVRGNGQRNRLGLAPSSKTTRFALTPAQVAGIGAVTFEAVPILRGGQAITSDQVNVTPTEMITLDIPPQ
jgi:hypothetical protein